MDIFVSYARSDQTRTETIVQKLKDHGFSVFYDRQLNVGDDFSRDLEEQIRTAKIAVVLWSRNASNSSFVKAEAMLAHSCKNYFGAFIEKPFQLPLPFGAFHTFALGNNTREDTWNDFISKIINSIKSRNSSWQLGEIDHSSSTPDNEGSKEKLNKIRAASDDDKVLPTAFRIQAATAVVPTLAAVAASNLVHAESSPTNLKEEIEDRRKDDDEDTDKDEHPLDNTLVRDEEGIETADYDHDIETVDDLEHVDFTDSESDYDEDETDLNEDDEYLS